MRKLPPPIQLLVLAGAAGLVTFPLASVQWRQDLGEDARFGGLALILAGLVLWGGLVTFAMRRLNAVGDRAGLLRPAALLGLATLLAQIAVFAAWFFVVDPKYRGPWKDPALAAGFGLGKALALVLALVAAPALVRLVLVLAGVWRSAEVHRAQVRRVLSVRGVTPVLLALLLALACSVPFALSQGLLSRQDVNLLFETLIYMTLALGLNVVVGYAGLLVLGYAAFWAIGAYTFAILALRNPETIEILGLSIRWGEWSMWACLPIAGLTAMVAGLLLGLPSLRLRGDYLAIVTLGFGEVVYYLLKTEVAFTGGEMGLPNKDISGSLQEHTSVFGSGPLMEPQEFYWPALALVVLAVVVIRGVERSRVGRALVALREDETAARCMGVNTTKLKLIAFAFSAMWAGLAGVLWTAKLDYTNPMYFYFMQSVMILAMVVLGGMGSIPGVMVGAVLLYAGPALLRQHFPEFQTFRLLIFGAVMVLLMIYRPQGLFGASGRMRGGGEGPS